MVLHRQASSCYDPALTKACSPLHASRYGITERSRQLKLSIILQPHGFMLRCTISASEGTSTPPPSSQHISLYSCSQATAQQHPSHNHTFSATTPCIFILAIHLHLVIWCSSCSTWTSRHVFVISPDFSHYIVEGIVDVDSGFGRCLDEFAAERSR